MESVLLVNKLVIQLRVYYADLCTEQLISLHPLAAYIAKSYILAARFTNMKSIVHESSVQLYLPFKMKYNFKVSLTLHAFF